MIRNDTIRGKYAGAHQVLDDLTASRRSTTTTSWHCWRRTACPSSKPPGPGRPTNSPIAYGPHSHRPSAPPPLADRRQPHHDEPAGFVIVGASLAGATAAQTLREEGFDGRITLIGDEAHRPYERPPLSKDYLQGKSEREKVFVHPQGWYAENDIDLQMGVAVTAIDRDAKHVLSRMAGHPLQRSCSRPARRRER